MDNPSPARQKPSMGNFLRTMPWLGAGRVRGYLRLLAVLNIAMLAFLLATSHDGVDRNGFLLGSDFLSFWTTGRMLHSGGDPYDSAAHIAAQHAYFTSDSGFTAFFYPPSFLPFCWPLGLTAYFPALAGWLGATGALWVAALRPWWREARMEVPFWLPFLAFPAVPIVITHGQTAFLVAGLLGLGAWLVPRRPVLAGVLFGLATIKPQFGVLVPLALLLTREWTVIAAAAVTALALGMAAALLSGMEVWMHWLAASGMAQDAMEAGAVPFGKMASVFAAARLLGAPVDIAYVLQAIVALGTGLGIGLCCRGRRWTIGTGAAVLAGAPLVTPFVLDYDMVLLAFPLLWLAGQGVDRGFAPYEKLAIALAFVAPAFGRPLALNPGLPLMPLVLVALFIAVVRRHSRDNADTSLDKLGTNRKPVTL